jgi:hypothetical protein
MNGNIKFSTSNPNPTLIIQMVLRGLIATYLPPVDTLMQEHDIELSLITLNWFLTLYSSVLHIKLLLRYYKFPSITQFTKWDYKWFLVYSLEKRWATLFGSRAT